MPRTLLLPALFFLLFSIHSSAQTGPEFFDGNNVKGLISPVANHFWDYNTNQFFLPKDSNTSTIYTSTIWIGGLDNGGQLHLAAERYRQIGVDFTPGPISHDSVYNPPFNGDWNRVWKVNRSELTGWLSNPYSNPIPTSVQDWPGTGNSFIGQDQILAPYADVFGDGQYDPQDGDHPLIKGDQAVYFMFNDDAAPHTESGGNALGVEIHGMAYGFNCPEDTALNNTLFMEYTIINRSENDYHDVYIGLWNDFDMGNPNDDYLGCDPLRNLFYVYNGDNEDEDAQGRDGYGFNLASQGVRLLQGPELAPNGLDDQPDLSFTGNYNGFGMDDGIVDNEEAGMYSFMTQENASGPWGDPSIALDYYRTMQAIWSDGTPLTKSMSGGYAPGDTNAIPARFMNADSADTVNLNTAGITPPLGSWTNVNAGAPSDRRGLGSVGPFQLDAIDNDILTNGHVKTITIAYVFAQKMNDRLGAMEKMKAYSDHIQDLFDSGTTPCGDFEVDYFPLPPLSITEQQNEQPIAVFPNPAQDQLTLRGELDNAKFQIMSTSGQVVLQGAARGTSQVVNVQDLAPGLYLLQVDAPSFQSVQQIIIQ